MAALHGKLQVEPDFLSVGLRMAPCTVHWVDSASCTAGSTGINLQLCGVARIRGQPGALSTRARRRVDSVCSRMALCCTDISIDEDAIFMALPSTL